MDLSQPRLCTELYQTHTLVLVLSIQELSPNSEILKKDTYMHRSLVQLAMKGYGLTNSWHCLKGDRSSTLHNVYVL